MNTPIIMPLITPDFSGTDVSSLQFFLVLSIFLYLGQVAFVVFAVVMDANVSKEYKLFKTRTQVLLHLFVPLFFVLVGLYKFILILKDYNK